MANMAKTNNKPDMINHPPHYNCHAMECLDEMCVVFGPEALAKWCVMTAWKYRYRAGHKGDADEDMKKADFYLQKAREIGEGKIWQRE